MNITIIGTGYVGLVTGSCLAYMGNKVTCLDVDDKKIKLLNGGKIPIYEPGLKKIIDIGMKNNCLYFSSNIKDSIQKSDIIFITVGTPMKSDGSSDLSYIFKVAKDIGSFINKYKIIITKSTIPVGTTFEIKKIISNKISNRSSNIEFDICNNPEFLKEGKAVDDFMSPDRIVVGIENQNLKSIFLELYKPFSIKQKKVIFMNTLSSEFTKYAANAMLATKISFINEMGLIADKLGADINEVRIGIGSDSRIGYSFIYPSVGYGGSCFPKDVLSVLNFSKKNGYKSKILDAVNKVNQDQKKYFFNKLLNRFKSIKNRNFGIWGLSFKPGTDDMRESASIYFVEKILKLGGKLRVYDPKAMENAQIHYFNGLNDIIYCENKIDVLENIDALILLTEWPEFRSLDFKKMKLLMKYPILFDGRNQFDKYEMKNNGFEYYQIGVQNLNFNC